jgi:hypothetical protein
MASEDGRPLLNPALVLRRPARREGVPGGGKGAGDIRRAELLGEQRRRLAQSVEAVARSRDVGVGFGGKVHLVAGMFPDSLAPTWAPTALFAEPAGCRLVAPARQGYVVEATADRLGDLSAVIHSADGAAARVDISRVETIAPFGREHLLRGRSLDDLWRAAPETTDGRLFLVWLAPFRDPRAREALMDRLDGLVAERALLPTSPGVQLPGPGSPDGTGGRALSVRASDQTSLMLAVRRYRNTGHAGASVRLRERAGLERLLASGVAYRVDPVRRVAVRSAGQGREPPPPSAYVSGQPIVAVVDGGLTAASYRSAEAWRAPAFVPDGVADHVHGNRVASLVVQAHAWNRNLALPRLYCRIGTAQAVPKEGSNYIANTEELVNYLSKVIASKRETKVWNFSFNESEEVDPELISHLGHSIAKIAREHDILPVISVGNARDGNEVVCPPGDCEAALVVGGRLYDQAGHPGRGCPSCLRGPGPDGMQKPDLSWFSPLRMLGGEERAGSSFPTCLTSSLAAHAFANLKEPTPDLVRALLLNATELEAFNDRLGWGTPYQGHLPWFCGPGSVTLLLRSKLTPKSAYYWDGIPIPPRLVKNGKLCGRGSLTAVLRPVTNPDGAYNYFATRIQTSLQFKRGSKWEPLLGSMKEDKENEQTSRKELAKWQPIRCHRRRFTNKGGLSFSGDTMRLFARVFARDLYQFDDPDTVESAEHEVAFVLSFSDESEDPAIYNEVRARLGNFVESAVLEQDVVVEL